MGWCLAAALHVLVAPQGGLPAVLLAAVLALELAAGVVRAVAVALPVLQVGLAVARVVSEGRVAGEAAAAVVEGVGLLGQHDVVGVVVLRVRLRVVLLDGHVVVLHERLLQEMRLYVLRNGVERF